LEIYRPKAVILDFPSTPLYECLHEDVEILMMGDPINPYAEEALKDLSRRVHYTARYDEMEGLLRQFVKGALPKKRDTRFAEHYAKQGKASDLISHNLHSRK
jgi:hypothetical protein